MTTSTDPITQIPAGVWEVDTASSELGFGARGMFGLVPVHGHFREFAGTLSIDDESAHGVLTIQAASLDTHNDKRDEHLRSADFFDVSAYPTFTFELTGVKPGSDGDVIIAGTLAIRETALNIEAAVTVRPAATDRMTLTTSLDVDRAAAGLGWSKMGMIKGKAHLNVNLTLSKAA